MCHSHRARIVAKAFTGLRGRAWTSAALSAALSVSIAACDSETGKASVPTPAAAAAVNEPYDTLEMDFRTPAAVLTNERHTGAFAIEDTLNMGAALKPLAPGEEQQILPLAEKHLTERDWSDLDEAFGANRDPLTGHEPEADYQALFTRIVNLVPAPIGLGAES